MNPPVELITPGCFLPSRIRAYFTTRVGGHSKTPWKSFNLAMHVGDDPAAVRRNRTLLKQTLQLPEDPCWLDQMHGKRVLRIDSRAADRVADASISTTPGRICAVLVADCVPLLLCDRAGTQVAAIHAGWRGMGAGIIAATVEAFAADPGLLTAWIGPTISAGEYRVGAELRDRFVSTNADNAAVFDKHGTSWHMDLAGLARRQLEGAGVGSVSASEQCVYRRSDLFYSYRRDGSTGRMAALIWIEPR